MPDEKENEQRQKRVFKMQKCPLCDKKIRADSKFCSECGWDLTDHELTPPQIARIQEEIADARFRAMALHVVVVAFLTLALVCLLVSWFATFKVIPVTGHFITSINLSFSAFLFIEVALLFLEVRFQKKKDRLKRMLRDRQPSQ